MIKCPNCNGVGHTPVLGHCRTCVGTGELSDYIEFTVPVETRAIRIPSKRRKWKFREVLSTGLRGEWQHEEAKASSNGVTSLPFLKAGRTYEVFIGDNGEAEVTVFFYGDPYKTKEAV